MPTGYTYPITTEKGISFEDFVMNCAKAFGNLIEDSNKPIPEKFEASNYYQKKIEETKIELEKFQLMTEEEAAELQKTETKKEIVHCYEAIEENNNLKQKYNSMLLQVKSWNPPTEDHINLKNFMIKQLELSIPDTDNSYYFKKIAKIIIFDPKWKNRKINSLLENLKYYQKENIEEIERVAETNQWINDLRKSLNIIK